MPGCKEFDDVLCIVIAGKDVKNKQGLTNIKENNLVSFVKYDGYTSYISNLSRVEIEGYL